MKINEKIYDDLKCVLSDIDNAQDTLICTVSYERNDIINDVFISHARLYSAYDKVRNISYELDLLERKEKTNDTVKCISENDPRVLELLNSDDFADRVAVAKFGFHLDKLVDDENVCVRQAVAQQGYGLDKLVDDEDFCVREAVAQQGYGLDKLVDDENVYVRKAAKDKLAELEAGESDD